MNGSVPSVLCRDPSTRLMDGLKKMWTGAYLSGREFFFFFFLILMYHGLQYVGLLRALYRALYTSCYCHII